MWPNYIPSLCRKTVEFDRLSFWHGKMRVVFRDESMTPSCIDDSKISHEITDGRAECLNDIHVVHEEL